MRFGNDRRHLFHQVIQPQYRDVDFRHAIPCVYDLRFRVTAVQQRLDLRHSPHEYEYRQYDPRHPGPNHRGPIMLLDLHRGYAGRGCAFLLVAFECSRLPDGFRLPYAQKQRQAGHGNDCSTHVDQPWAVIIGNQVLGNGEGDASDQNRRPDFLHAAPPCESPDQPERDQQREKRKLATDHC